LVNAFGGPLSDNYQTPDNAIRILLPYLPTNAVIWEPAWGQGRLANFLQNHGYKVVGGPGQDFRTTRPPRHDLIVTNFPFSEKDYWLARFYALGRPFALLLPADSLVGVARYPLFAEHGIQLLIPSRRINYILPDGSTKSANFNSFWYCWKLLPEDIVFADMPRH
jgi:hypothetical protein